MKRFVGLGLVACLWAAAACGGASGGARSDRVEVKVERISLDEVRKRRARYADVSIGVDPATVSEDDRAVLQKLVAAAGRMNDLYWRQSSPDGPVLREELARGTSEHDRALYDYLLLNAGPYDRLDGETAFLPVKPKPAGGTFYPLDLTKAEFDAWIAAHPGDREAFESPFTVIRRDGGNLVAVPYSKEYGATLEEAAKLLDEAAALARDPALKKYLSSRAAAFRNDDYFQSDMDWMDLGTGPGPRSAIEVVIGPYEVYEDGLFGLKAAFEAFLTLKDEDASRKLALIEGLLDELEAALPVDDRHKNFSRGKSSPISVVNVVLTAGDANKGVQTAAFNLPNDERVRSAKGSKKVMLKNVMQAKFNNSLIPIAAVVVDPEVAKDITFDAYFNFVLMHEVSHGLGPGIIALPDGSKKSVNQCLKDLYSAIEETKADTLGAFTTLYLANKGTYPKEWIAQTEASYLAGIFRSVRFGAEEAHGKANMIQFNFLRRFGAFTYDAATGRFGLDRAKFEPGLRALAKTLLTIEAEGDYDAAKRFLDEYGAMPPEVRDALVRLKSIPIDIRPEFTYARDLVR